MEFIVVLSFTQGLLHCDWDVLKDLNIKNTEEEQRVIFKLEEVWLLFTFDFEFKGNKITIYL